MSEWKSARLLSRSGMEAGAIARARAAEAFLAVVPLVPSYAAALMKSFDVRVDSRTSVETFVGVRLGTARAPIADGVIRVSKGSASWSAAVLVRTGTDKLTAPQVKRIRDAGSKAGLDAVITIANEADGPNLGRSRSRTPVHHWAWGSLLAAAVDQKVRDVEQSHLLGELVQFLGHPDVNVASFGDMGPSWSAVVKTARTSRLSKSDPGVADVCRRWDQVVAHAALALSRSTETDVQQVLPAAQRRDPKKRLAALVEGVTSTGQFDGVLKVPGAAGDLAIVADLEGRRLVGVVVAKPPKGLGERATLGWLLDGLDQAPTDAVVEAWAKGGRKPLAVATVAELNRDMSALQDARGRLGDSYRVLVTAEMGTSRSTTARSQGFTDTVTDLVQRTWEDVLGPLSGIENRASRRPTTAARPKARSSKSKSRSKARSSSKSRAPKPPASPKPASRKAKPKATRRSKSAAELARELRANS